MIRFIIAFLAALVLCSTAIAQAPVGSRLDPTGRSGDERPDLLRKKPPEPSPELVLPPPAPPKKEGERLPLQGVFVRKFLFSGNSVYTDEELAAITAPYENRKITNEDLEAVRRALTIHYVNNGYVNSGVVIPDQTVVDGKITLNIIEGELTRIQVEGNKWFRGEYIQNRLALGAGLPLNIVGLQERLQLLQQDTRIERIHAELKPGVNPGESVLNVNVEEEIPFKVWLGFNNYQSPSVGAERGLIGLSHENFTGHGDILNFTYGRSEGLTPQADVRYSLPLTAKDTAALFRYRKNDFDVVKKPFEDLKIMSESEIYEITLRHPFYRTLDHEFTMALTGEHLRNRTFLLGEPFSFSPGAENGESRVSALRFTQEWNYRTRLQVVSARSRFSVGIDALEATKRDGEISDGEFISWLGQFQWARMLRPWDAQILFRLDTQVANDHLLPLEQIAVGGRYSVRGYRENLLVRDKALIASLESRIPIVQNRRWADYVYLIPFTDYGVARNQDFPTPTDDELWSVGLGMQWGATWKKSPINIRTQVEFFWGHALKDVETTDEYDLQDDGIHFQFVISGF